MTYEREIPDFAMVPARAADERIIIPVTKGAIYTPVQVTNITEKPKTVITIEEDILVPDTKPDLREILLIDGKSRLAFREMDQMNKSDDYISLTGEVELQTLYSPENSQHSGPVIAVQTRVPFKDRWHVGAAAGGTLTADCKVEKIEYMVINERKYRVKISLAITAREFANRKVDVFEGISGEEIQMLKEKFQITNIAQRKRDTVSISQTLEIKEDCPIENILIQDITAVENYKQITGEKIIINGFIYVNLLYTVCEEQKSVTYDPEEMRDEGGQITLLCTDHIHQAQERVEFTQFIPISQGGSLSGSKVFFDSSGLKVKLVCDEDDGEVLRLEGDIITYVELYSNEEKEIIVDGYHREKDFLCDFNEEKCCTLVGQAAGETSVREIISPDGVFGEIEKIIYTTGDVSSSRSRSEQGKMVTEGTITAKLICQSKDRPQLFAIRQEVLFRIAAASVQLEGGEIINEKVHIKDVWAERINGKQIEFNGSVAVNAEIMEEKAFKVLANPAFEEAAIKTRPVPMVVYVTKEGDTLWSIAKAFKTTTETINQLNQLEGQKPEKGRKLLILK